MKQAGDVVQLVRTLPYRWLESRTCHGPIPSPAPKHHAHNACITARSENLFTSGLLKPPTLTVLKEDQSERYTEFSLGTLPRDTFLAAAKPDEDVRATTGVSFDRQTSPLNIKTYERLCPYLKLRMRAHLYRVNDRLRLIEPPFGNSRAWRTAADRSESILCTPACCNLRGMQHSLKNDAILFRPLLQST